MADIDEYDKRLLADRDLLERFGAGDPVTDEEVSRIQCIPAVQLRPFEEKRVEVLLHKRQFGLD